jgi:hypothetical protein
MIERISYNGWMNAWRISNRQIELVVLADVGPRVVRYGFCGSDNVLYEVPKHAGLTGGTEFRLYGGHRLWAWPEVPRTYFPDNRPVLTAHPGAALLLKAEVEDFAPGTHLQKELEIELDANSTRVSVTHRITNRDDNPTDLAMWCPTMLRPGGKAILPLPARAAMDTEHFQSVGPLTLWSFTDLADPRWQFGTEFIELQQDNNPRGRFIDQMTGIFDPAGWGAYYTRKTVFLKQAEPIACATYPDFGCNFEVFTNADFLELETLGPKVHLQPNESATHKETWSLHPNVPPGTGDEWIHSAIVPLVNSGM